MKRPFFARVIERTKRQWKNIQRRKQIFQSHLSQQRITIPTAPLHFAEMPHGYYCMRYVRLAAERIFHLTYAPAPAWRARNVNHVVWRSGQSTQPFYEALKPGQIIGMRNPASSLNRPWRPYTHVALFIGQKGQDYFIMHRIGTEDILETIRDAVSKRKLRVIELLEPETN